MSLSKYFEQAEDKIKILINDINAIKDSKKNGTVASRSSLEPVTRLRRDADVSHQDSDLLFVFDKVDDIFRGSMK